MLSFGILRWGNNGAHRTVELSHTLNETATGVSGINKFESA